MFFYEIWLFDWYFPQFCISEVRSTDISKCFRGSLRLRDNESRLYFHRIIVLVTIIMSRIITLSRIYMYINICLHYLHRFSGSRKSLL